MGKIPCLDPYRLAQRSAAQRGAAQRGAAQELRQFDHRRRIQPQQDDQKGYRQHHQPAGSGTPVVGRIPALHAGFEHEQGHHDPQIVIKPDGATQDDTAHQPPALGFDPQVVAPVVGAPLIEETAKGLGILVILGVGVLALGIYPKPLTDLMEPSIAKLAMQIASSKLL